MFNSQQLYLVQQIAGSDNTIIVVSSGLNSRYFDLVGSTYVPHFFIKDQLTHGAGEFILTTTAGRQIHFNDFTVGQVNQRGKLTTLYDHDGNGTSVVSLTDDGKTADVQRSVTVGGATTVESYLYTYLASPDLNAGRLSNVTLRRGPSSSGPWT